MDLGAMTRGGAPAPGNTGTPPPAAAQSDEEYCKQLEAERQKQGGGGLAGAVGGRFGRLMGRGRQQEPPPDPRCVKK
jgi:hypothetical protein